MPQFAATIRHIKDGVKSFTIAQALKNIEGWEATIEKSEVTGTKTILGDLERLKNHLQGDDLDGEAIRKIVAKLAQDTLAVAKKVDGEKAEKIQALGEALAGAAEEKQSHA